MARERKRRTIVEETLPPAEEGDGKESTTDFDLALESVEDIEVLRGVLDQYGQTGAVFKIYRVTAQGPEFCYQTDDLDEEFLQRNCGGGEFQVRIFINGVKRHMFKMRTAPPLKNPDTNGNGNGHNGDRHTEFLEKMLLAYIQREGSSGSGPSVMELTQALANLDGLRGKSENTMDNFLKGVEFAKGILGDRSTGDWKSDLVSAAKDALPVVGAMLGSRGGRPPVPVTAENPGEIPPVVSNEDQNRAVIQQGLNFLKKKCLAGMDTDLIIDWVVNNAEDYQPLIHIVLNVPFDEFIKIDAEIGREPFTSWFKELFNGLRLAFVPADPMASDTTGNLGDIDHAGDDGKSSKTTKSKGK